MTPSHPLEPTAEQRREAAHLTAVIVDSCSATESLLHDLFALIARIAPDDVADLRDQAAICYQAAVDDPARGTDRGHCANRLNILDGVMTQAGRPQRSTVVVSINEHWKRRG